MPAPRLLDKKVINATLAQERKQDIEAGKKLVESVQALREARVAEEQSLEDFRVHSLQVVQAQIDAKLAENQRVDTENKRLKAERLLAQAPINLKEEWQLVREDRSANTAWEERLVHQSIELLAREEDIRTNSERLSQEEEDIREEHLLARRTLEGAEAKFVQADDALQRAEKEAQAILTNAQQRENHVKVREEDATVREIALSKREEEVDAHEIDLANREVKLKSRQEMFIKAQNYIKKKK